jgi:hypothetical protein
VFTGKIAVTLLCFIDEDEQNMKWRRGSQFCADVVVRLTIVILKNVAVASLGENMTSVIPNNIVI